MDLSTRMSREFSAAKLVWGLIVFLQIVLLACSMAATWATGATLMFLGGAVLVIPVTSLVLKWRAETYHDRGERLRRAYVLQNALGQNPEPAAALATAATATNLPKLDPEPIGEYFASPLPQGMQRLAENIGESAFYTWRIAALASYLCAGCAVAGMCVAVLVLWWAVQAGGPEQSQQHGLHEVALHLAKLFSDFFSFVAAGVFAELWWVYRFLSRNAECVFAESLRLAQQASPDSVAVFTNMGDYDTALVQAPPLPGTIKWLCNKRLAALWAEHLNQNKSPRSLPNQ